MATIPLVKTDVPFWLGGDGTLTVDVAGLTPTKPIPENTKELLKVNFGVDGEQKFTLGSSGSATLGVKAGARATLTPVFNTSTPERLALLKPLGLEDFFDDAANHDKVVLILAIGADASAAASASFAYSVLKASVSLDAGVDGAYFYTRALPKTDSVKKAVETIFKDTRLPSGIGRPPGPGEVVSLQYGGYLKLGAELSAGYALKGTKDFTLGGLALSERYGLSVLGKVGLQAQVAGRFSIEVRAGEDAHGAIMKDWARVVVRRQRSSSFSVAADVKVDADQDLRGLPETADEFLGAALGVNAKNFITVLNRVHELSDFETLKTELDGLAKKFIGEFVGKAFDALPAEFPAVLAKVNRVVTSYEQLGDRAITLFDRYFAHLETLTEHLDVVKKLESWAKLRESGDSDLWAIVRQLTDGDPLGWALGKIRIPGPGGVPVDVNSLDELKARADKVLALIKDAAHTEIRDVIAIAKRGFGIDGFMKALAQADTPEELKNLASGKLRDFIARLLGKALDAMTSKEIKEAADRIKKVLDAQKKFTDNFFAKLRESTRQSLSVQLHTEYSRSSERDALVDVMINLSTEAGRALLRAAGDADFTSILRERNSDLVRLNAGVFTHKVARQSAFNINIVGWHLNYQYAGFDRVITETEQRIVPAAGGGLIVYTTLELSVERARRRREEAVHAAFLLRALGESHDAVTSSPGTHDYLIETLTELSASYSISFTDEQTTEGELRDYLSFAKSLGLDQRGATASELIPMLPKRAPDDFGNVTASYDVRYRKEALAVLLKGTFQHQAMRHLMRQMVLANYIDTPFHEPIGWAYATAGVFELWKKEGFASFVNHSARQFEPISTPIADVTPPTQVTLNKDQLRILDKLFAVQETLIDALRDLSELINEKSKLSPEDFEKKLAKFGKALNAFDAIDQVSDGVPAANTMFYVFDRLIELYGGTSAMRLASLAIESRVNDKPVTKMFVA